MMATTTTVLAIVLVLMFGSVTPLAPCKVDCSHYATLGNKADDPFNCHMYYLCYDDVTYSEMPFSCPGGEFFDTVTKNCMKSSHTCSPECLKCTFDCSVPVMGKASHHVDCSKYYECGAEVKLVECPSQRTYFDGRSCQTEKTNCCSCTTECSASDVDDHKLIPDLHNCTNFYTCVKPGIPEESARGHCLSGNFVASMGTCVDDALCVAPCQEDPTDPGCVQEGEFVCEAVGYFPMCTHVCDRHYYTCTLTDLGHTVEAHVCTKNNVMDPLQVHCVAPEQCPCPCSTEGGRRRSSPFPPDAGL
ncbi:uncharacterized protein [Panulirus ornatus]|uniref:uncharacterized protein n=1 Tax=Panulirus ornatus TaxID=150431 RepID=UPI003A87B9BB